MLKPPDYGIADPVNRHLDRGGQAYELLRPRTRPCATSFSRDTATTMKSDCHGDPRRARTAADFSRTSIVPAIPHLNWESRENKRCSRKAEEAPSTLSGSPQ